jgi:hypothetical protein
VGGESGPKARPMSKEWVTELRDQCLAARVPFFFKQWGGTNKKKAGRLLDGRTWDEMPHLDSPPALRQVRHLPIARLGQVDSCVLIARWCQFVAAASSLELGLAARGP